MVLHNVDVAELNGGYFVLFYVIVPPASVSISSTTLDQIIANH